MDSKFRYHRSFFIFDVEDNGFATEQIPSGYVKIEIKEGRGKLFCQVSNLTENEGNIQYQLFMIKADENNAVPMSVGNIELSNNRGDLEWSFDPYNIKANLSFDKFNVFAVLANYTNRQNDYILCPLVAYKNGKVDWRKQLNIALLQEKATENGLNKSQKNDDKAKKVLGENIENINKNIEAVQKEQSEFGNGVTGSEGNNPNSVQQLYNQPYSKIEAESDAIPYVKKPDENKAIVESNSVDEEKVKEESFEKKPAEESDEQINTDDKGAQGAAEKEKQDKKSNTDTEGKSYSSYDGSKLFEMYTEDGNDNLNVNTNCVNCIFMNNKNSEKSQIREYNSEELTKQFDSTFEKYSPFLAKRTDYTWWKVGSPVHLNNILYSFGIKIPVLFNPLVLMAHYKYNHLIVGIYRDEIRERDYIVCGIPGIYWVDEKPFGNACRWAQVEGNTPTYGAFGYWIVYINPKTGKILSIEE